MQGDCNIDDEKELRSKTNTKVNRRILVGKNQLNGINKMYKTKISLIKLLKSRDL